ncbi:insulin-like growth factor-binding protein 6 [Brachionichthys hirsutus]|uniref:insulin-like growth factor-binding protein 6 n=1 Tax=Brachionichthys hirsutus TaxID=412623 RepID=UPI0036043F93
MLLSLNILMLLLPLQSAAAGTSPVPLPKPSSGCPTCKSNATALGVGEPCGVYTPSCAQDLRCAPPEGEARPLRALLEGRGVCSNASSIGPVENNNTAEPAQIEHPEEAPCRKLLTTLIRGLNAHLFDSHHDIYMPNCDKRGFFRRKQCWSSRGKRRGRCWCVDRNGMPVPSNAKQKAGTSC